MERAINPTAAANTVYDAVVVGSGVSGSIIAKELSENGLRVLVLEAGPGQDFSMAAYDQYLTRFYGAAAKENNAAYPDNPNAPTPRSNGVRAAQNGEPDASHYLVQRGAIALDSVYTRVVGGTTMHWEGKTMRMLPEDFEVQSRFGVGRDWPLSYEQLGPYYRKAEFELGVSGEVEDQAFLGITFDPGYVYPMHGLPPSYLDQLIAADVDGTEVDLDGELRALKVRTTPQARNGPPNPDYDGGKGFKPVGAVSIHPAEEGGRCQGNNNCVPLCPVQAKYNARKTLAVALATGRVDVLAQAVASRVHVGEDGRISHIEFQAYDDPDSPKHTTGTARGRIYVLAANPVENARLMLASGLPSRSGLMGRNLMDHAYLLTWALMPQVAGTLRGAQCTSGIDDMRGGAFRQRRAPVRFSIHNDGWGWATGSPYSDLLEIVDNQNKFGAALRHELVDKISRQLLLDCMVELLPDPNNRVTVDEAYKDQLGNPRPILAYDPGDYTMAGIAAARQMTRRIFQRLGAEDCTRYDPSDPAYLTYEGEGYVVRGGNHWAGTHIMGDYHTSSVVDFRQRSWDHENLYLVGGGSMPTVGTSNTTLTLAALCFLSAEHMIAELKPTAAAVSAPVPAAAKVGDVA
jgi:choline dehydrogenase-like flavoprotein